MFWVALLVAFTLAAPGAGAWYISGRQLAATTDTQQRRLIRLTATVSAGIGVAILIAGVVLFVVTGYDWRVLIVLWAFGLLHLGLLRSILRRVRQEAETPRAGR
jgi:hypothetical protein